MTAAPFSPFTKKIIRSNNNGIHAGGKKYIATAFIPLEKLSK
jgi:hypothetical protein